jgi:phage terminase large subunit GpA-like protein
LISRLPQLNAARYRRNALKGLQSVLSFARPRQIRPLLQFCEEELRYPTGRYKGQPFRREYQPATSLLLEELSKDHWLQTFVVGPHQAGKSFAILAWLMWTMFEKQEDVIFGLPDLAMRATKWKKDILPLITASRYSAFLPTRGTGSHGGVGEIVLFENGVSLQFMGSGGGATQRAGATCRNLIVTEAEAWGVRDGSGEGNKFEQICGRVSHYAGQERIIAESTVTVESGLMWSNWTAATASTVVMPCHCCGKFVAPEREHLVGWDGSATEDQARAGGRFSCPECGETWTESERIQNLRSAKLKHNGQEIGEDGTIIGSVPPTRKLGFRFSAATNAFANAGSIAVEEWSLARTDDNEKKDSGERVLSQFRFAKPVKPQRLEVEPLDGRRLLTRVKTPTVGLVPSTVEKIYAGVDLRKTAIHAAVVGFSKDAGPHVIEWIVVPVDQTILLEEALRKACGQLQARFREGFQDAETGEFIPVSFTLVDAGWQTWVVQAIADADDFWMPAKGIGSGLFKDQEYKPPRSTGKTCRLIGNGFHLAIINDRLLAELDSRRWKSRLHAMLRQELNTPTAMTIALSHEASLREYIAHLTSETEIEIFVGGEIKTKFSAPSGPNHWFDATYMAIAAKHIDDEYQKLIQVPDEEEFEWDPIAAGWG